MVALSACPVRELARERYSPYVCRYRRTWVRTAAMGEPMGTKVASSGTKDLTYGGRPAHPPLGAAVSIFPGTLIMVEAAQRGVLEQQAVDKSESGELPVPGGGITRAGAGSGLACDLCAHEIEKSKIEYEVEWCRGEAVRVLRFHLECFQ